MSDKSSDDLGEEYCRVESPDVDRLEAQEEEEERKAKEEKFGEISLNHDDYDDDNETNRRRKLR